MRIEVTTSLDYRVYEWSRYPGVQLKGLCITKFYLDLYIYGMLIINETGD